MMFFRRVSTCRGLFSGAHKRRDRGLNHVLVLDVFSGECSHSGAV